MEYMPQQLTQPQKANEKCVHMLFDALYEKYNKILEMAEASQICTGTDQTQW